MASTANRKPRNKPERFARLIRLESGEVVLQLVLIHRGPRIGERIETFRYRLSRVATDYGTGYELWKISGDDEHPVYHVHFDATGNTCDCQGAIKHGHCKHQESLKALEEAGRLANLPFAAAAAVAS